MHKVHGEIKEQMEEKRKKYKDRVDHHRKELQFEVGDQVLSHLRKKRFPRGT
jgi:hypothetical protein